MPRLLTLLSLIAPMTAALGCGGPPPANTQFHIAKGSVTTADGKPVSRANMKFVPVEPAVGREDAYLLENGQYTVKLVSGKYKVTAETLPGGPAIPRIYASAATTTLLVDATQDVEVNLQFK